MTDGVYIQTKNKVVIDIGGTRFATTTSTLQNLPNTRLERLATHSNDSSEPVEFFFDRNPFLFEYILDFYRTGELHLPQNRCGLAMKAELEFWGIGEGNISSCCWKTFTDSIGVVKTQAKIEREFSDLCQQKSLSNLDKKSTRATIWAFLTYPKSSTAANVYSIVISVLVALSLLVTMLGTVESFRTPIHKINGTNLENFHHNGNVFFTQTLMVPHRAMILSDTVLVCFVFLEFCVRFLVCPDKRAFFLSFSTFADIIYFLPIVTLEGISLVDSQYFLRTGQEHAFMFLQWFVALRILRLHRIASCIHGFNILTLALKASLKELLLLVFLTLFAGVIFAFAIFYAEMLTQDNYSNAFYGMWWALITMTSVGYGDFYPESSLGYVLGVLCALVGLIFISLPVPMVANNFNLYYAYTERSVCNELPKLEWLGNKRERSNNTGQLKVEDIY